MTTDAPTPAGLRHATGAQPTCSGHPSLHDVKLIAKVLAYGVPALLILIGAGFLAGGFLHDMANGFVTGLGGKPIGDSGAEKLLGIALIVVGIVIYVVELRLARGGGGDF